jgi:hypothetical protein
MDLHTEKTKLVTVLRRYRPCYSRLNYHQHRALGSGDSGSTVGRRHHKQQQEAQSPKPAGGKVRPFISHPFLPAMRSF